MTSRLLQMLLIVLWLPAAAAAQATDATIIGTVTDESKAVLPGVTVTATDLATGRQYVGVTDERGEYRLPNVSPGEYKLQAELTGFSTVVIPKMEVLVGRNVTVPFTMTVAGLEETLTVTGEAPLVDTRSTQIAGNVDRRQMEELPLQGRNWLELSMLAKGVTTNDVAEGRPGAKDGDFQVNLDGQQISQAVSATFAFGQPGMSRDAIAEYQIVTNLFDVTQGRSAGVQVQAISRSGTNNFDGSFYGYFRHDALNAPDFIARRVIPYQNQQLGGSFGGPIQRDKIHFFATYEYEREPNTFTLQPPGYQARLELSTKRTQHRFLTRGDWQPTQNDHVSARFTSYREVNPFGGFGGGGYFSSAVYPTEASDLPRDNNATSVTWSRVISSNLVQEVKGTFFHYHWRHTPAAGVPNTPLYQFPGFRVGARSNYPEEFWQNTPALRYDLTWHKGSHDIKIGGEYLHWRDTGWWLLLTRGRYQFSSLPADLERRFPLDAWNDPSRWDLSGLDATALFFQRNFALEGAGEYDGVCPIAGGCGNWTLEIPRPTWSVWLGDTWALTDRVTVNFGARYDLDYGAAAPPLVEEYDILIDNGRENRNFGYRDIRDWNNLSPRGGFNWDLTGNGDLVVRGGTGVYYGVPVSELAFDPQLFNGQRVVANFWVNDNQPGFVVVDADRGGPQRGQSGDDYVTGRVPLPPQAPYVIDTNWQAPTTWQSSIGAQKQFRGVFGVDADLIYYRGYYQGNSRDPNLFFDPATGYYLNPNVFGRPNPAYGRVYTFISEGRSDNLSLATSLTKRFEQNWQAGLTYTLMFFRHDTGTSTAGAWGVIDNPFCVECEWGTSNDFQRHTLRFNAIYRAPWDITIAAAYFAGSGNKFATLSPRDPLGSSLGANRLNGTLGPDGRLLPGYTIVPRNAIDGDALHKVDLRFSKDVSLPGGVRITGIAEVFNVFNHENYGAYVGLFGTSNYGRPAQNTANTYLARSGQLAFKVSW